ncbi:hypothetical protein [Mycobacteroides abscessus]|uniref:hypothetical protein n=1 Tax=Mycobacteroides abscessus TaxID=36809 RepID=UPI001300061C|nr:hypothetical protein [Mycobacteroides abscessus]
MPTDHIPACFEKIPGVDREVNVFVRESFWYAAELINRGWSDIGFNLTDSGCGFTAVSPQGSPLVVTARTVEVGDLACLLAANMCSIFQASEGMLHELQQLIRWREKNGPIAQPARGSTLSWDEASRQYNEIREGFARQVPRPV